MTRFVYSCDGCEAELSHTGEGRVVRFCNACRVASSTSGGISPLARNEGVTPAVSARHQAHIAQVRSDVDAKARRRARQKRAREAGKALVLGGELTAEQLAEKFRADRAAFLARDAARRAEAASAAGAPCPRCGGDGLIRVDGLRDAFGACETEEWTCPNCEGTGIATERRVAA